METYPEFGDLFHYIRENYLKSLICGKSSYSFYTSISFALCLLLIIKFFGFDRTYRCNDDICELQMVIVLFSLAYSTIHLSFVLFGKKVIPLISSQTDFINLAIISAGIAFFVTFVVSFMVIIYSVGAFDNRWSETAFYCLCWLLQPVFTLLAVYMWKKETNLKRHPNDAIQIGNRTTVFSVEPRLDTNSEYTSLMISPRLSTALIQQWIDRLCEVEMQNDPIEMRRTVREVLQHMNSMISPY